jgi:hypothetical protein
MKLVRLVVVLIAPLLLASCFLAPGAFTSSLDIRRNGDFTFAYKGEIVFLNPNDLDGRKTKVWDDRFAKCFTSGRTYTDEYVSETTTEPLAEDTTADEKPRPCTRAEIGALRKEFDEGQAANAAKKAKDAEEMAAVFGLNPMDEVSARKIAAEMMKYQGWKAVTFKGKGVYEVDYQIAGRIGHDFIFPLFPQGDVLIPFVTIRNRGDGAVLVSAPALSGGGGLKGLSSRAKMLGASPTRDMPQSSVMTKGRFTVTTDGEILTNNTADGPAAVPTGRQLAWDVDAASDKIPEALIRLR